MSKEEMIKDLEILITKWSRLSKSMIMAGNHKEQAMIIHCSQELIEVMAMHKYPNSEDSKL